MVAQAEASMKEDYASADDSASKLAFAEKESHAIESYSSCDNPHSTASHDPWNRANE
ncbi:MAG: hypothetical protein MKZ70_12135 [Opitutales bacterium]|nr:hypothetical protein [Opitutales bacterium]MCH2615415.1 hypothetical protein [Opitutales bacterium]